ncbi:dihydrodipicolinate synthase family protein [Lunatibacter salilacus]|uniref:dihydrodipicolinate synthase family protein n=1 Tax=Lunatibacter salilacus TaxID=2483804 RepID=UPI001F3125BA|nr:dihydrodipicolinate synthase family protein [Lunatibacter salilacus]
MSNTALSMPLRGIIPPLVTPLLDDQHLDLLSLEKLVSHLLKGGVHGLFILGTTGECTSLSYTIRKEMIANVCRLVDGRVPVLVGITDTAPEESIALTDYSKEVGAAAVVAAPPYYFGLSQPELITYFEKLAGRLSLPLFLYNMPSHTKTMIAVDTVEKLAKHPNIVGFKDSSANATYFNALLYSFRNQSEFSLFVGPEEMMASAVLMGAHGGVSGGANMFPKLYVTLYEAAKANNMEEVLRLQEKVMEVSAKIYSLGTYGSSYLKGLKAALSILGLCDNYLAGPYTAFEGGEVEAIRKNLESIQGL